MDDKQPIVVKTFVFVHLLFNGGKITGRINGGIKPTLK